MTRLWAIMLPHHSSSYDTMFLPPVTLKFSEVADYSLYFPFATANMLKNT